MADAPPASSSTLPPQGKTASPTLRGIITYLLFLHFFFLLVGIKSNTASSGLDQDLRRKVPGIQPYLQLLEMDVSYMFHLTHYDGQQRFRDTDYVIEAEIPQSDNSSRRVVLESLGNTPPIRDYRYRQLAFAAADLAETQNESVTSILPQAVARRLMLEYGCNQLTLRVRRRLLQDLMLPSTDPRAATERSRSPDDPAYFQNVYEARAFMTPGGEVNIAEIKADYDTAAPEGTPPTTPPAAVPTPTAPQPTGGAS